MLDCHGFNPLPANILKHDKKQQLVKNGEDNLAVLNNAGNAVIEQMRSVHPKYVFSYRGKPITKETKIHRKIECHLIWHFLDTKPPINALSNKIFLR